MSMTVIEKILAGHSGRESVRPGDIVDVKIDARVARDFGGANVVKHMEEHSLEIHDPARTFFTFDCNPTGSDQKYAANQHACRKYALENGIRVYDINKGIGTHVLVEEGHAWPGSTAVSTDSHANILGAIGAFGQGMGDKDIAATWHKGSVWFKVPETVKIIFEGMPGNGITAKDMVLNLLGQFGSSSLLGYAIEVEGELVDSLSMDQRFTMASMATELGAIIMLFPPGNEVIRYCESRSRRKMFPLNADPDAVYARVITVNAAEFRPKVSLPGKPHHTSDIPEEKVWIDSAFIGSCTNGRIEDLRSAAAVLHHRRVAPGVVLKIVPATDRVWQQCLEEGLIETFKESGALVSNAGCAGCAAGQVGQNGPGEVTVSTGNRNFPGKQGQGEVYLASPDVVAASAVAGYITTPEGIPAEPPVRHRSPQKKREGKTRVRKSEHERPVNVRGRVWYIPVEDIDTDMIFHNRYLGITNQEEMGRYAFDNLEGYRDFADRAKPGDIVVAGKNFGAGSSRQQAVDCFLSLGISCIVAGSFGAIYERNAINAAFPILASDRIEDLGLETGHEITVNFDTGEITNHSTGASISTSQFSEVQMEIYQNNGLF